jgi:hypothetical protein
VLNETRVGGKNGGKNSFANNQENAGTTNLIQSEISSIIFCSDTHRIRQRMSVVSLLA